VQRDDNGVRCTPDTWKTPLSYISEGTARGADRLTVCDPMDPLSPLTPHAVSVTAPLKPYHGRTEAAPADQEPLVVIDNIPLRLWELRRVPPTVMMHDEAMNAYISLLERREATWAAVDQRPLRFHFFNTFFSTTLTSGRDEAYNYEAVARWSRNIDFKENETVLIPINMANIHWFLAVVLPQRRVVDTYDSVGSASDWMLQCNVQWGQDDARTSGHPRGRWQKHKVRYRKQDNGKDCGVFVLKRMDHISRDIAPERMTGSMNYYRRRICSGSKHHHVGSSSGRSDLLTSSVRRRNCPGNRPIAQPPPNGRRGSRKSPGGSRSPKHSWFYQTTTGTASPLSINPSQTRTPVAKVATPNAPNR